MINDKLQMSDNSVNTGFLATLQQTGASEIICLATQTLLTLIIARNLKIHWNQFPIKQLSPLCTLTALLSFLLLNVLTCVARLIEGDAYHFDFEGSLDPQGNTHCGQCRLYDKPSLRVLMVVYSGLRELPLTLFTLKTLRVSICFLDYQNKQLPKFLQKLFGNEKLLILTAAVYSGLISLLAGLNISKIGILTPYNAQTIFQFFCPKVSGFADWIITIIRYISLAISYSLSILAYRQLDFKRFIFFIFVLSNIQVIMRCIFVYTHIDDTTYHEFYYHSIFLNFCGTLILYPYTNFNRYVRQPPSTAVLQSFDAFLNCSPGATIIKCFSLHLDQVEQTKKYQQCFNSFIKVRAIKMEATLQPKRLAEFLPDLQQVLELENVASEVVGSQLLLQKIVKGDLTMAELKRIEKNLMDYCQKNLYEQWKKTQSRAFIEQQFKKNVVIDEKMNSLGINLGY